MKAVRNIEEDIAYKFLHHFFGPPIIYEPDGNVPPDFLVHNHIGVEVRRLDQQFIDTDGKKKGVEEISEPFIRSVRKILREFDGRFSGRTFAVMIYKNSLHLPGYKNLRKQLLLALENFLASGEGEKEILESDITITIMEASPKPEMVFFYGAYSNNGEGGVFPAYYLDNFNHCVEEKSRKIERYYDKYEDWWLLLIDGLGGLTSSEKKELIPFISLGKFHRLILIDYEANLLLTIPPS